jgi:cytochrome c-type protein NapB
MMPRVVTALIVVLVLTCGCAEPTGESVPEEQIGLAEGRLEDLPPIAPLPTPPPEPGEAPAVPASFEGAPPSVPHTIADYLPITRDENLCVDCHLVQDKEPGDPTPIPESHFMDLRHSPDVRGDALVGTRWSCVACHVAPQGVEPLVTNRF